MCIKKAITFSLFTINSLATPISDSMLLTSILGQQIQATAGILKIFKVSSENLETAKELHGRVEGVQDKAVRLKYYTQALGEFPKNRERVQSLVEIRNNLEDGNNLILEGGDFARDAGLVEEANRVQNDLVEAKMKSSDIDDREIMRIALGSSNASSTGDGTVATARATAYNTILLSRIDTGLDVLNNNIAIQNQMMIVKQGEALRNEYYLKKRWGMIPDITFAEYLSRNNKQKNQGSLQ